MNFFKIAVFLQFLYGEANSSALPESPSWVDKAYQVGTIAVSGLGASVLKHPIFQPLSCIKAVQQANPGSGNMFTAARQIYLEKGIVNGLYAGGVASFTRAVAGQMIRMPAKVYLPPFCESLIKENVGHKYVYLKNPLVACITAAADALLLTPLERIKTMMMTRKKVADSIRENLKAEHAGIASLYRGASATVYRDIIMIMTFLVTNDYGRDFWMGERADKTLALHESFISSLLTGGAMTITGLPFDLIKTLRQRFNHDVAVDRLSTLVPLLRTSIQKHGYGYLWAGFGAKYTQNIITAFWNIFIMDYYWGKMAKEKELR